MNILKNPSVLQPPRGARFVIAKGVVTLYGPRARPPDTELLDVLLRSIPRTELTLYNPSVFGRVVNFRPGKRKAVGSIVRQGLSLAMSSPSEGQNLYDTIYPNFERQFRNLEENQFTARYKSDMFQREVQTTSSSVRRCRKL
ncbi:hypothetical protein EVAR_54549_1 [Eumeta japonica]|uniref:Uncharacterized protein n=1 Tax=Eumeta variegata TaxID=151549 RepID=A0A4C1YRI8_EUMVA|nr:hypothetical protein EVAR_54549_1 [Eumeta japonica]